MKAVYKDGCQYCKAHICYHSYITQYDMQQHKHTAVNDLTTVCMPDYAGSLCSLPMNFSYISSYA